MRRLLLIFTVMLFTLSNVSAQDITGKWKCSKEILDRLNLGYNNINGYYKFYRNGKFKLLVKGRKHTGGYGGIRLNGQQYNYSSKHRLMYFKAKGRYKVENGRITTSVKPKDVKAYVDISGNPPRIADAKTSNLDYYMTEISERSYNSSATMADVQSTMIRAEKWFMWSWRDLSVRLTSDSLVIGRIIKCGKE
ncbi:MAG: hypothetical protein Q4E63_08410 [Prevotellaceae bacterium]|nr:hypothetical protein [Prevotellaceae bacterium]